MDNFISILEGFLFEYWVIESHVLIVEFIQALFTFSNSLLGNGFSCEAGYCNDILPRNGGS